MATPTKFEAMNRFLLDNHIKISENPAVSPDLTLDFDRLLTAIRAESALLEKLSDPSTARGIARELRGIVLWPKSVFSAGAHTFYLIESAENGDGALVVIGSGSVALDNVATVGSLRIVPLLWSNLIKLKNLVLENDPSNTIFPKADGSLKTTSLGVGARFTTLHWPAVAWAMNALKLSLTANQNSIPRELVYDVDAMLGGRLTDVPFPFIGRSVPEGHQGQSVQGMSYASIITYLKYGFHHNAIPYGFNADHQPIGGRFDKIEQELVDGSLFASYITYDLSPELSLGTLIQDDSELEKKFAATVDAALYRTTLDRLGALGFTINEKTVKRLVTYITPSMNKMKQRDDLYTKVRLDNFTTEIGRRFFKELSIDELPGETTPETLAVCLAMSEAMGVEFNYVAPNIGFQKNFPYPDNDGLKKKTAVLYDVAKKFGVSIGFHSGSGKSAENYTVCGEVTGGNFEVKTSGRYTYEMGVALSKSSDAADKKLWFDWYDFTRKLALVGAFAENEVQRKFAREFILRSVSAVSKGTADLFESKENLKKALDSLVPSPDHMFWFEYNFLFVLAAQGSTERLGDHSPEGYAQRKRFYAISDEGKLLFAKQVAGYILFLAETTGIVSKERISEARVKLETYSTYGELLDAIGE